MLKNPEMKALAETVIARCQRLARFSEQSGRITRTFLSPAMHDCHREIARWLEPLGAEIRIDAAGNFRALYGPKEASAPRLLIGSHLDTVPDAGAYDGILGVVLGAALVEALHGERLPFAVEVLGFSEEEGVRFGTPFIGSRALVGRLDQGLLATQDQRGISVRRAIEDFGLRPDAIPDTRLQGNILGYLEFHIEQGPVLEELELSLAVVDAIAGQSRLEFTFLGHANHAGTTPMRSRRDALAGAAEWIVAVEREARRTAGLVATVGTVIPRPGAANVIAGEVQLSLDVRHREDRLRLTAVEKSIRLAEEVARVRGLTVQHRTLLNQHAVVMDSFLAGLAEQALRRTGCRPHRMVSGAGHDAMILAEKAPAAMIFLRTPGGISHSPEETVRAEDVEKAVAAGLHLLKLLSASPAPQERRTTLA